MNTMVRPDMIFDGIEVRSKEEALKVISHLCAKKNVAREVLLFQAFQERENMYSTGFGDGIAIPHARVRGLTEPVFALVRFAVPVEWEAVDGQPVDLAVVAVMPAEPEQDSHLPMLAMLARKLMNEKFVEGLRLCRNRSQLYYYMMREMR